MKVIKYIVIALCPIMSLASTNIVEQLQSFRLEKAHPRMVLNMYGGFAGKRVEVVENTNIPLITLNAERVTERQILELIELELNKQGIGLFEIDNSRIIATYIDPKSSLEDAHRYLEYCKAKKELPRLDGIGWKKQRECWEKNPELKELRSQWQVYNKTLRGMDKQDEAYNEMLLKRKESMYTLNIQTLEFLISEYSDKGQFFPSLGIQ